MNQVSDNVSQPTMQRLESLTHSPFLQIITILDIVQPSSFDSFKEVYLVQELMETDLHRVIRTQDLSDDHCQYFVYQVSLDVTICRSIADSHLFQTCRALKALHCAESELTALQLWSS